jgi:hypothetical protein
VLGIVAIRLINDIGDLPSAAGVVDDNEIAFGEGGDCRLDTVVRANSAVVRR